VIVGDDVPSQSILRPRRAVRDLDEFIAFVRHIEAIFGRVARPRPPTIGDHFLL
jgi:hypothetical protein